MTDELPEGVLPVVDADGSAVAERELRSPARMGMVRTANLVRRLLPKGNTRRDEALIARWAAVRQAQGRAPLASDGQDWREQLHQGQRSKAAGTLGTPGHTHNSGSGFGCSPPYA